MNKKGEKNKRKQSLFPLFYLLSPRYRQTSTCICSSYVISCNPSSSHLFPPFFPPFSPPLHVFPLPSPLTSSISPLPPPLRLLSPFISLLFPSFPLSFLSFPLPFLSFLSPSSLFSPHPLFYPPLPLFPLPSFPSPQLVAKGPQVPLKHRLEPGKSIPGGGEGGGGQREAKRGKSGGERGVIRSW